MKISRSIIWTFVCLFSVAALQGCALLGGGDDQQQEGLVEEFDEDDQEGDEEENQQNQEDEENSQDEENNENAQFNANDMANLANNDAGMLGAEGMGVPDNTADGNMAIPTESNMGGMEDLNSLMNQGANNIADNGMMPSNMAGGMETIPTDPSMANMVDQSAAAPAPMAAASAVAAPGDARVYFVVPGGAELKDGPGGNTVGSLAQGEPVLGKIEGEWANITNRGYIAISQLSTTPVGREQAALAWQ